MPKPTILEVFDYFDDDEPDCAHCGEPIYEADNCASEPEERAGRKVVVMVHAACAVRDGFVLIWPGATISVP